MKSGVFTLSMADYRKEHGVSQSALKRMAQSPAHLQAYLREPEKQTPDTIMGCVLHTAVFEPELLDKSYWVKPENYENKKGEWKKWNGNAIECKDWIAAHEDRPVISTASFLDVGNMAIAVRDHPAAAEALAKGKAELSLFCEDPDTGLQLKCRPDWLSGNAFADLKKCQDASPSGFARSIANFGYDVQAAFYLDIAGWLDLGKAFFLFIAVEDSPPYGVSVYELDKESIQVGRSKYRRWLTQYLDCAVADKWPAYPSERQVITLPSWNKKVEETAMLEYSARPQLVA